MLNFYDLILLLIVGVSIYRYRALDHASRIFTIYIWFSVASEIIARSVGRIYHNNMPVYAVYSVIEFVFLCVYFNNIIDVFKPRNIGYHIAGIGVALGLYNMVYVQGIFRLNSYFLIFEAICIISMSLFFFARMFLQHGQLRLHKYHHFWFAAILSFFWSITFIQWGLYEYINVKYPRYVAIDNAAIVVVSMVSYLSMICVYLFYPKMQLSDD